MIPDALLHDADLVGRHGHPPHLGGDVQRPLLGNNQEVAVRVVEACGGRKGEGFYLSCFHLMSGIRKGDFAVFPP